MNLGLNLPAHRRWPRRIAAVAAAVLLTVAVASDAEAFGSEGQLWAGAGAANLHHPAPTAFGWWGPSLQLGAVVHAGEFLRITADMHGSHHFETEGDDEDEVLDAQSVAGVSLGARYALDVFTYVPYVGLAAAFHPLAPPSQGVPGGEWFSLRATIGLDYRRSREWSVGAAADVHAPMSQPGDFPHYSSIRVHVGWHFRL